MKLFSASQVKAWDAYTIAHEPVASVDLMERAAQQCAHWLQQHYPGQKHFKIFCGKGNNGGDGLALARLLHGKGYQAAVFILEFGKLGSEDFQINLQRLHPLPIPITFLQSTEHLPPLEATDVVIDALYGSGLKGPLDGLSAALVQYINNSGADIISIDVPSGLLMDASSIGNVIIKATHTLTFQTYKLALLMAENAPYMGTVHVLPIGLHPQFEEEESTAYELVDIKGIISIFKKRNRFAHKGTYGHALLIGGSLGKTGAVVLSAKAALRTGVGLLSTLVPRSSYTILQSTVPEAMTLLDAAADVISAIPGDLKKYAAVGAGPGLGTEEATQKAILDLVQKAEQPLVLDADALNILSFNKTALQQLPAHSIVTPHPKEAERLFGPCNNDFERIEVAKQKAAELNIIVVLKGHHTFIALPDRRGYFNSTGNAGMAKGGSGDVLTGIITSLLAQGYAPAQAAVLGVYLHGLAGDKAAQVLGEEAMLPSDLIRFLPQAFAAIRKEL